MQHSMTKNTMSDPSHWRLPVGANVIKIEGKTKEIHFRVWAPKVKKLSLCITNDANRHYEMKQEPHGYYSCTIETDLWPLEYMYLIDDTTLRPDPASRWQPYGVHKASRVYDHNSFIWKDSSWHAPSLEEYIIYELHVGLFTEGETFEAIIEKLGHLKQLGITAIELMPVGEFAGCRNWGYDATYPYAPHHSYGGPEGLKKLINACHLQGLCVIVDVVYNHLGPEGNYLAQFGHYFTDSYKTPWGEAINYDGPHSDPVREYFIHNALHWLVEYHVDALRLDAIHAIFDKSALHILKEIEQEFQNMASKLGKKAYLIAESDLNDVKILNPWEKGGYALDSQWNDDFHHAIYALFTKNSWGYFQDFGDISQLAKAIDAGYVYDGIWSEYRQKRFGSSTVDCPGKQFVISLETHDQIANASQGKRFHKLVSSEQYRLASMILFCAPNIPFLFMGQEWASDAPFLYFTSFDDEDLAHAVAKGYSKENLVPGGDLKALDPQNEKRFLDSKLNWKELQTSEKSIILSFYEELISLRKKCACLSNCRKDLTKTFYDEENNFLILCRSDADGSKAVLVANCSDTDQEVPHTFEKGKWELAFTSSEALLPNTTKHLTVTHLNCNKLFVPKWTGQLFWCNR